MGSDMHHSRQTRSCLDASRARALPSALAGTCPVSMRSSLGAKVRESLKENTAGPLGV